MTWNYQWTGQATFDSRIVLTNFPDVFRSRKVQVTRYRISRTVHSGPLTPVETFVIAPRTSGRYTSQTLSLEPNELRLLVLTPTE